MDLKVFISSRESTCDECGENLGRKAWISMLGDKGALCLACADLEHLVFPPSGDAALTRRAHKYSTLAAVVWTGAECPLRVVIEPHFANDRGCRRQLVCR